MFVQIFKILNINLEAICVANLRLKTFLLYVDDIYRLLLRVHSLIAVEAGTLC